MLKIKLLLVILTVIISGLVIVSILERINYRNQVDALEWTKGADLFVPRSEVAVVALGISLGINITVVRIYDNFSLNATNRDEIIEGIYQKLSKNPLLIVPSRTDWLEQKTGMKW